MSTRLFVLSGLVAFAAAQCAINSAATNLIQGYEKFRESPYNDGYGYYTIGYGHKCNPNNAQCSDVCGSQYQCPISEPEAQQLFSRDIASYESCLTNSLKVCLNDNQYGALVSWTYNIGCSAMEGSTLIKRMNNGEDPDTVASQELPRWDKSGGRTSTGLQNRRRDEVNLFEQDSSNPGNCQCGGGSAPAPSPGAPTGNNPPSSNPPGSSPPSSNPPAGAPSTGNPPGSNPPSSNPPSSQPPSGSPAPSPAAPAPAAPAPGPAPVGAPS